MPVQENVIDDVLISKIFGNARLPLFAACICLLLSSLSQTAKNKHKMKSVYHSQLCSLTFSKLLSLKPWFRGIVYAQHISQLLQLDQCDAEKQPSINPPTKIYIDR